MIFTWFWSSSDPYTSLSSLLDLWFKETNFEIDVQDGSRGSYIGFPIETILPSFDLQVTLMLSTKFLVNWTFRVQEEKFKIDFFNMAAMVFRFRSSK